MDYQICQVKYQKYLEVLNEGILVIARLGMAAVDMDVVDMVAADADMVDTVAVGTVVADVDEEEDMVAGKGMDKEVDKVADMVEDMSQEANLSLLRQFD
ncbi:hypothetical protein LSP03_34830 [Lysinibacillus sphaericus]|nr:hypothetical protein LSP03_34830 [Lysinibacillus sphaericus]